jgi:amino acid adenylation domain-containing protein
MLTIMTEFAFGLHPAQRDVFLDQLIHPASSHYTIGIGLKLSGNINIHTLKLAIAGSADVFDVYRMRFDLEAEELSGYFIQEPSPIDIIEKDFSDCLHPSDDARSWIQELLNLAFDIRKGTSLIQHSLLKVSETEYWWYCKFHHLICDGVSFNVQLNYVAKQYRTFLTNDNQELSCHPYLPEVINASRYYKQDEYEADGEYWKNKIGNQLKKILHKRVHTKNLLKGARSTFKIDDKMFILLKNSQLVTGSSLMQLTLAAIVIYFGRVTNERKIIVGVSAHRRSDTQRDTFGLFAGIVPFVGEYCGSKYLQDFLKEIAVARRQDYTHQNYIISDLARSLAIDRDAGFFDIVVNYEKQLLDEYDFGSLVKAIPLGDMFSQDQVIPLQIRWRDYGSALELFAHFSFAYFESKETELLLNRIVFIISQFSHSLAKPINEIQLVPPQERFVLLKEFNDKDFYPAEKTLINLFEKQVIDVSDQIAVVYQGVELSYGQLNERANRLADYLQKEYDIKKDDLICLCLDKSQHIIIAILGVLKAGAAYVPMDPDYPDERMSFVLSDTKTKLVLTNEAYSLRLRTLARNVSIESIDSEQFQAKLEEGYSKSNPKQIIDPFSLAYVIYTSGTTGVPKGVMVEHRNVARLFEATDKLYGFNNKDTWVLFHSYIFDFTVWEIWGALLYGGKLFIPTYEQTHDPDMLFDACHAIGITVLNQTPTAFYQFSAIAVKKRIELDHLRYVIFGGEALNLTQLRSWYSRYEERSPRLINMYGITETTVHVTYKNIEKKDLTQVSSIGCTISDLTAYILDDEQRLLPIGTTGELYIGGGGVARGYLNRPELTAERFIANPFQTGSEKRGGYNSRLYKTGDLVRYLPDGNLEYIGRSDFQVKIRGYRIELGEIESRLLSYPAIQQAVVLAREREATSKYLVAYYVSAEPVSQELLESYLAAFLPAYMIPGLYVRVEQFPVTVNGKLDRQALPDPDFTTKDNYEGPNSPLEERLCELYAEVLGVQSRQISVKDDFFKLGGDSIIAIRLASKINKAIAANIRVNDVFSFKSARALSEYIDSAGYHSRINGMHLKTYKPFSLIDRTKYTDILNLSEVDDIYPASYLQNGMLFESENNPLNYHNITIYRINDVFNHSKLVEVWNKLYRKHEMLRARFLPSDSGYDCIIAAKADVDLVVLDDIDLNSFIRKERLRKFEADRGGLLRIVINRLQNQFDLVISAHHVIEDGWSMASLVAEFVAAYIRGTEIGNQKELYYGKFVAQEKLMLKDEAAELFWKKYLADYTISTVKWKDSSILSENGLFLSAFDLGKSQSHRLHQLAKSLLVGADSIFLYAFIHTLGRFLNKKDVIIGLVVNNRLEEEVGDKLFGLFLNTIPFRYNAGSIEKASCQEIINVFRHKLDLNKYKAYPYGKIKQLAGGELFEFAFNFIYFHILKESIGVVEEGQSYGRTNIPFVLNVIHQGDAGFHVSMKAHDDRADPPFLDYFMRYYRRNLENLLEHKVEFKELLPEDSTQLIQSWPVAPDPYLAEKTLIHLFEEQAVKVPDQVAVVFQGVELSYYQLNERANRLADYLQKEYDVKKDNLICLCLDRSQHMIISILGVLKAGAAYVPMDPDYPDERMRFVLSDTQANLVLTNEAYSSRLRTLARNVGIVSVDSEQFQVKLEGGYSKSNPKRNIDPFSLAYVIYTSGTTGVPKGVMVEHRNVSALLSAWQHSKSLVGLSICAYVFDVFVWEVFNMICHGHTLHVLKSDVVSNPEYISKYICENNITITYLPPTQLPDIADYFALSRSEIKLVYLLVGVMPITQKLLQRFRDLLPHTTIVNGYGPTETTVWSTVYPFDKAMMPERNVPIGKALKNYSTYVLDDERLLLPIGTIGELYLGGCGVARGYLNRPELTAERFIANPFQTGSEKRGGSNSRLYKTGDLVRYLPDGNLEYIGRSDFQVKIRGYRIELGEIENRLLSYPGIEQAVVLAREREATGKYLVAYYLSDEPVSEELLENYLAAFLPAYMMPGLYVRMEQFPVTVNGKLDRQALPDPDFTTKDNYEAPDSQLEERLCEIYAEVLGVQSSQISVNDDFFKLGGHSILAIQLVNRINKKLGRKIDVSSIAKYKTIRRLARQVQEGVEAAVMILPVEVSDPKEQLLSFAQERLWFIESYEKGSNAYNIPIVFKIKKGVDVTRILDGVKRVAHRHEVLRSVIKTDEKGVGYQQVLDDEQLPLKIVHYVFDSKDDLAKTIRQSVYHVFDLEKEYPLFIEVYRCGTGDTEEQYISFILHHIAFDAWSTGVFIRELHQYYNASDLPDLPLQYKDYALWQRSYLTGGVFAKQLEYWKNKLSGYDTLYLPTDRPRPARISYAGDNIRFEIDDALSGSLRRQARDLEVSLFSLLLSAYYLLLKTYSGQQDIIIGSPIANRQYHETHELIGFFVNTLALREYIEEEEELETFVQRVSKSVSEAQLNQDLSFEKLVDELRVPQDSSRHPIFQVMFVLQHHNKSQDDCMDALFEPSEIIDREGGYSVAKFDLTMSLYDTGQQIRGTFNYATSLFDKCGMEYYVQTYLELLRQLEQLSNGRKRKVGELTYINSSDYNKLVHECNQTRWVGSDGKTLVGLFEEQVATDRDQIAVVYQGVELSYGQLDEHSNQLAHYLKSRQVMTGDLIGICMERSFEMIIGLLAILKSGAGYVPIDSEYPQERIDTIMADLKNCIVLSTSKRSGLFSGYPIKLILLDSDWDAISRFDKKSVLLNVPVDNVAYVLYTSGSTGKPKGVEMPIGPLANLILWRKEYSKIAQLRKVLQFSSLGFDLSFFEIFFTFACGGTLVLIEDEKRRDATELVKLIHHYAINTLFLPYAILESVTDCILQQGHIPDALMEINVTAEQLRLSQGLLEIVQKNQVRVFNLYGPTETHVATSYEVEINDFAIRPLPPIGKPLSNATAYVLDRHRSPLPAGAIGELYIGGGCVARGYLNRPELTAERFITNPFQTGSEKRGGYNSRLYKTGDLVRYLPDGNLEYFGRNDFQVKIRGYRIEPGEIENRLLSYPGIEQAVVLAREREATGKYLVAYYVSDEPVSEELLESYLAAFLPAYMMPGLYVRVEQFPVTVNGKLDRQALPDPDFTTKDDYEGPDGRLEERLCEIYAEALGVQSSQISVKDDFFKLGGHSILAIQLVNRINKKLGLKIDLSSLLEYMTIRQLSRQVQEGVEEAVMILPVEVSDPKEQLLSFAQERLWFIESYEGGSNAYNIPMVFKIKKGVDVTRILDGVKRVAHRHEVLRSVIKTDEKGVGYQQVLDDEQLPLKIVHYVFDSKDDLAKTIRQSVYHVFDLEKEYPLFIEVYRCNTGDTEETYISFILHHIAFDGWSTGVFIRELHHYYNASDLPDLPLQYKDYALWQRSYLTGGVFAKQLEYWKNKLSGYDTLYLPTDRPRPARISYAGDNIRFEIDDALSGSLRRLARDLEVSLFSLLLSAYYLLLKTYSGQRDIIIGSPIANRQYQETHELIGFFVNTLALREYIEEEEELETFVQRVSKSVSEAQLHQDLPFEKLVDELRVPQDSSRHPIFQVMFVLQHHNKSQDACMDALFEPSEIIDREGSYSVAKFDLTMSLYDTGQQIRGAFNYATGLFDKTTVVQYLETYKLFLEAIGAIQNK